MSKDAFALAYSVKRMAKTRRAAPVVESAPEPLESVEGLDDSLLADETPQLTKRPDIGKIIKKHRFFGSK
jgi:hypothetical protein